MGSAEAPYYLRCLVCNERYAPEAVTFYCPECELEGALDVIFDYAKLGRDFKERVLRSKAFDMWRYQDILPVGREHSPGLHTGGSPLYRLSGLCDRLYIKDDSRNPSGSLKDRASALAVALAMSKNVKTVAAASTGNAAAALACMCSGNGPNCVIFAPTSAAREKIAQIRAYGAHVVEVEGGYDEAFAACHVACKANGWWNRSTGINSYMSEGKKTVAFEIFEQLSWSVPDRVFVPVGNGCIVGAIYKGFHELREMGYTGRIPKIVGVQASGSDYMLRAWQAPLGLRGTKVQKPNTTASSISVALPRDRIKALRAIRESDGEFVAVSDAEIYEAVVDLARQTGVFAEPGAAAAYAGARKLGALDGRETVVVVITGSGLKDVSALMRSGVLETRARHELPGVTRPPLPFSLQPPVRARSQQ